jgi:pimeloyl-ACP methyl ester carboxylesterase
VSRKDLTFTLSDGRQLGYAEWGADSSDTIVFDLHGGPGCRYSVSGDVETIAASGVRWITIDRPGLGLSWPKLRRTVADFASDLAELADALAIDSFHVLGWSMGGPYAGACAALLGDRVRSATLFAPASPILQEPDGAERQGKDFAWKLARDDPWQMAELYTGLGLEARRSPPLAVELFAGSGEGLSPTEAVAMARPDVQREFIDIIVEATRQGGWGLVEDMRVTMAPWGYELSSIDVPISLWQGDDDSFTGVENAQAWVDAVPKLQYRLLEGQGHMFPFERTEEFLASL